MLMEIDLGHRHECDRFRHDLCGTLVFWGKQIEFNSNMYKTNSNKYLNYEYQIIIWNTIFKISHVRK